MMPRVVWALVWLAGLWTSVAGAQNRLVDGAQTVVEPSFTLWTFRNPVADGVDSLKRIWQFSVPLAASVRVGGLTFDVAASAATAGVRLLNGTERELNGLTDARVRVVGRFFGDRLTLIGGVNAPVGTARLNETQVSVLRVVAAPALQFGTPVLGLGVGGSAGMVYTAQAGEWGLALGTSFEVRGRYAPIESAITQSGSALDLDPGNAVRVSIGADRFVGEGRFSLMVAADVFGFDRLIPGGAGSGAPESRLKLGPQVSVNAALDLSVAGFQRVTLVLADRYRTPFTGTDGRKTAGSSGNRLELAAEVVTGGFGRSGGVVARLAGAFDSGLNFDKSLLTTSATTGAVTLGYWQRAGRAVIQPFVRVGAGRFDPGTYPTAGLSFGGGLGVTLR